MCKACLMKKKCICVKVSTTGESLDGNPLEELFSFFLEKKKEDN